jgi:hypothetical protein
MEKIKHIQPLQMSKSETIQKHEIGPVHLIVLFGILQLLVTLLTDGFCLSFDEAMWHYIGRNWFRHGMVPYSGGTDNKSPLIFAIYGLSDLLFGVNYWFPRVLGTLCQSIGLFFVFKIGDYLAGRRAGIIALTLYGLSLLWRTTDGKLVSLSETYAIACIVAAFYLFFKGKSRKDFFGGGLIAGVGLGFRLSAAFGILAILISYLRKKRSSGLVFLGGVLVSTGMLLLIAVWCGISLKEMLVYGLLDNYGSGSTTDHTVLWKLENFFNMFFYSEMLLFYPALLGYFFTDKRNPTLTAWLISVFIGINVIGIYARPHFKELLPALSLACALFIDPLIDICRIAPKQVMLMIWILFFPKLLEPLVSFKKLFIPNYAKPESYCTRPFPQPDDYAKKKLGLWVKCNTREGDLVLVAGYGSIVQAYSERRSPSIYFNVTQTRMATEKFLDDINASKATMVLVPEFAEYSREVNPEIRSGIDRLTRKDYHYDSCVYGYSVYSIHTGNPR